MKLVDLESGLAFVSSIVIANFLMRDVEKVRQKAASLKARNATGQTFINGGQAQWQLLFQQARLEFDGRSSAVAVNHFQEYSGCRKSAPSVCGIAWIDGTRRKIGKRLPSLQRCLGGSLWFKPQPVQR
jgi:hypothetical protein